MKVMNSAAKPLVVGSPPSMRNRMSPLSEDTRAQFYQAAEAHGARVEAIFLDVSAEESVERDHARKKNVGESYIKRRGSAHKTAEASLRRSKHVHAVHAIKSNEFDTVFPVQLKVYEFDRSLTNEETSIISDKSSYPCTNDQAQTIQSLSKIDDVIVRSCDLKATEDQIQQVGNYWLFDQIYNMYIPSRNVFIHIAFDSRYIDNPHEYLYFRTNDYLRVRLRKSVYVLVREIVNSIWYLSITQVKIC